MTVAILGAGNGGFAAAVHLTQMGLPVRLWGRSPETLAPVRAAGGLHYRGVLGEGFVSLSHVTTDLAAAVRGADLVMVCLPAPALAELAVGLAAVLTPGQPVLLNPGSTGGALLFRRVLAAKGKSARPLVGETATLTYISRKFAPAGVHISSCVQNVPAAALPGRRGSELARFLAPVYPTLRWLPNTLATALCNLNAMLHPPGTLLGAAWIEATGGNFRFYYDAATPAVARVMAELDRERLAIARGFGLEVPDLLTLFSSIGSTAPLECLRGSYQQVLRESLPNREIMAPPTLDHRYMHEDTGYGLVPMEGLGRVAGVPTPVLSALITLNSTATGVDYRASGLTLARLGLEGCTSAEIIRLVEEEEA